MEFRDFIEQQGRLFASRLLYHTTGLYEVEEILKSQHFKADPFVSFGESCLFGGDINKSDVCLGIDFSGISQQLMKVEYTEEWYSQYPEHGSYIAGEGWQEQWNYEPEDPTDEFGDDDDYEDQYKTAEMNSFMWKDSEKEWISKRPYQDVTFSPGHVQELITVNSQQAEYFQKLLPQLGYKHVEVR